MTDDLKSMMDDLLSPASLQPKIDVLESNISGNLSVGKDELEASVTIKREGTAAVTEILDKAVKQFFEFINIPELILRTKLFKALEGTEEVNIELSIKDHPENNEARTLEISVKPQKVDITITGYPDERPKDESIAKYYFEHEQYPGKVLPNGKFDYRELQNFPSVKKEDKILFISNPIPGKHGVTYSGRPLMVNPPQEIDLNIKSGIIREDGYSEEDQLDGYYLKAANDGVIIISKTDGQISEIDVSNEVKLDKIDFSTGNIGSEFKSPVSMEIGEIGNEFKVSVDGRLKVENLYGGIISTNENAVTVNVRDNSKVTAKNNIKSKNVADSTMESIEGTILIEGEIRDSKLKAPRVHFICKKGQMLNVAIGTIELILKGGYYCGVNDISLGKELFQKRLEILDNRDAFELTNDQINTAIGDIKTKIVPELKDIASQIADEKTMDQYRILIRHFQSLEFTAANDILTELRKKLNVMQIDSIKKSFSNLNGLAIKQIDTEGQIKTSNSELLTIEERINSIKFQVAGEINPTATIKFFCNKKLENDQPVFEIKSTGSDKNEAIDISGSYNLEDGFVIS